MTKDARTSVPNSVGGVNVTTMFKNTSDKTIKYVYINCTPYNAVDDAVPCSIRGFDVLDLSITGPIEPNTNNDCDYAIKWQDGKTDLVTHIKNMGSCYQWCPWDEFVNGVAIDNPVAIKK